MTPPDDTDENDRIVVMAKRAGRALGFVFVLYLIWSLGAHLKFW